MGVVDDVVEACARIVSEEDSLRVGALTDTREEIHQWVVTIVLKARGDDRDIHEAVGLHDDESRGDGVALRLTAEEVKMHAGLEDVVEILHMGILCLTRIVDRLLRLLPVFVDDDGDSLGIKRLYDASFVGRVLLQPFCCRTEVVRKNICEF